MKPHHFVFGTAAVMLASSAFLSVAERFARASSVFTGVLLVCGVAWGMLLTERRDAVRRSETERERRPDPPL